jgi:uncharacterized lipoprotein
MRIMLLLLSALALAACAGSERDTRYMHSEQRPMLQVPAGMDTPNYNPQMKVPDPVLQPAAAVAPGIDIERPPQLDDTP